MAARTEDKPKGALQSLAELWGIRPVVEIASQIGLELRAAPASIAHEVITRGWFGREIAQGEQQVSSIWGRGEERAAGGIHGAPALNETGIHGRADMPVETAVGIHGPGDQLSLDLYGLTVDERDAAAATCATLVDLENPRAVAQLDAEIRPSIGIYEPDHGEWSLYDAILADVRREEPSRETSRSMEMERE